MWGKPGARATGPACAKAARGGVSTHDYAPLRDGSQPGVARAQGRSLRLVASDWRLSAPGFLFIHAEDGLRGCAASSQVSVAGCRPRNAESYGGAYPVGHLVAPITSLGRHQPGSALPFPAAPAAVEEHAGSHLPSRKSRASASRSHKVEPRRKSAELQRSLSYIDR